MLSILHYWSKVLSCTIPKALCNHPGMRFYSLGVGSGECATTPASACTRHHSPIAVSGSGGFLIYMYQLVLYWALKGGPLRSSLFSDAVSCKPSLLSLYSLFLLCNSGNPLVSVWVSPPCIKSWNSQGSELERAHPLYLFSIPARSLFFVDFCTHSTLKIIFHVFHSPLGVAVRKLNLVDVTLFQSEEIGTIMLFL